MTRFTAFVSVFLLLSASASTFAAQKFPYTAQITEGEAIVYSSPGAGRYETQKLKAGDKVEVYQIKPDGWCAIRPPVGSFSWVCGLYIDARLDNIGVVTVDQLSSRIGSQIGETCKTVQVQLKKGERIVLLERVETPSNTASPVWYKIVPPSGEFRWIRHESISTASKTARPLARDNGNIVQASFQEPMGDLDFEESETSESESMQYEESFSETQNNMMFSELAESDPLEAPNSAMVQRFTPNNVNMRALPQRLGPQYSHPSALPPGLIVNPMMYDPTLNHRDGQEAAMAQQSLDPYQRALSQLNQEIHAALNRPTEDWMFETMLQKGKTLADRAPTEYDRTRATQMVQVLEKTRNIRKMNAFRREQSANFSGGKLTQSVLRNNTNSQTPAAPQKTQTLPQGLPDLRIPTLPATAPASNLASSLASPTVSQAGYESAAESPNRSPFKASGRLGWFSQRPEGYPPYALVNEQGQIISYVTPQPGVDLKPHINKQVGLNGTSGVYINGNQRAPHIGATAVFPL